MSRKPLTDESRESGLWIPDVLILSGWLIVSASLYPVYAPLCPMLVGVGMLIVGFVLHKPATKRRKDDASA